MLDTWKAMFSAESGGSKAALAGLAHRLAGWGWPLLDAQVENPHLMTLGARLLPRTDFLAQVAGLVAQPGRIGPWNMDFGCLEAAEMAK